MDASPTETEQLLLVRGGARRWALPIARVLYVGALGPMLRLPHGGRCLTGAVAHHGDVLPVFDLARLLGTEDPAAAFVAFVRRAGQTIGLRLGGIEGIRPFAGADAAMLDLEALDVPVPRSRPVVSNAAHRRDVAKAAPPPERGLRITVSGQAFWLPVDQVAEVLDATDPAAVPVAVPWADPRAPAILLRGNDVIAVVRLDLLLDVQSAPGSPTPASAMPNGTMILCRVGRGRVAIQVDAVEGLAERGATPKLELEPLLQALPGANQAATPPSVSSPPSDTAPFIAIVLAAQSCLLPLRSVRSVAVHVHPAAAPGTVPNLIGMRAMRGQILPVVDARGALGLPGDAPAAVDIEVVPPDGPAFVLAVQQLDGIVRLAAPDVHAPELHSAGSEAVDGVVRLGGRLAWLLTPSALAPRSGLGK